jgi:recyclin-1
VRFKVSFSVVYLPGVLASTLTSANPSESVTKNGTSQQHIPEGMNQLDLLLSLDVALELIQADREALKRVEGFAGYPGHYGYRVRDTIEELFILMLQTLGDRHVTKGFAQ